MKLAAVYFDDLVVIPGAKDTGGGVMHDLREQSFHASDGWVLHRHDSNVYSLWREGMREPAFVEGYGTTFAIEPTTDSRLLEYAWRNSARPTAAEKAAVDGVPRSAAYPDLSEPIVLNDSNTMRPKRRRK